MKGGVDAMSDLCESGMGDDVTGYHDDVDNDSRCWRC